MTLGNKIAYYRKSSNITQEALAQQLGVTNQAVSKWEADQCCPDVMLLPKLADIFDTSIDTLFDREPQGQTAQTVVTNLPWKDDGVLRVVVYVGHELIGGGKAEKDFACRVDRNVAGVLSMVSVTCGDVTGNVSAGGNVNCAEVSGSVDAGNFINCANVGGNVDAGSSVNCASVAGHVDAGNDVTCGNVLGHVDAGNTVNCGNVEGSVDAGGNIKCCDVAGDVDAGGSVECGNVGGDIDAGGTVTIRKS